MPEMHVLETRAVDVQPLAYTPTGIPRATGGAISRTRVFELIRDGSLAAVKCGRRTLIPADSLLAYLAALPRI